MPNFVSDDGTRPGNQDVQDVLYMLYLLVFKVLYFREIIDFSFSIELAVCTD